MITSGPLKKDQGDGVHGSCGGRVDTRTSPGLCFEGGLVGMDAE